MKLSEWLKIVGLLLGIVLISVAGNTVPQSNLQLLHDLFVKPVTAALDSLPEAPQKIVILRKDKSEFGNWVVNKLQEAILEKKIQVFDTLHTPAPDVFIIDLEKLETEIGYRVKKRNWIFRPVRYFRKIDGILAFSVRKQNGSVLYSREREVKFRDEISAADLKTVENRMYAFSQGTKTETKFVKRFLEPVIITGATAGVIYLFYTLRSGS